MGDSLDQRTHALLLVVFSLMSALALLRGHRLLALLCCLLALLSKEEAVLLPAILAIWAGSPRRDGETWQLRQVVVTGALFAIPLAIYFFLRLKTTAYLPWNAPTFYSPTFSPQTLARNILEYADRACTFAAVVVVVCSAALRQVPRPNQREGTWALMGLAWLVAGYGLTVFLPVRSSLYACFASVGAAITAAALVHALLREGNARVFRWLVVAGVLVPLLLWPVYRSRNARWVKAARFSAELLAEVEGARDGLSQGRLLVLYDTPQARVSIRNSFGTAIQEAVRLQTGLQSAEVWVEPPLPDWNAAGLQPPGNRPVVRYWLRDGHLSVQGP